MSDSENKKSKVETSESNKENSNEELAILKSQINNKEFGSISALTSAQVITLLTTGTNAQAGGPCACGACY